MKNDLVLVIDRDRRNRQAITIILELNKIGIQSVESFSTAIKLIEKNSYDLIVCDADTCLEEAEDFVVQIKSVGGYYKKPLIVQVSDTEEEILRHCMHAGADDFIRKPYAGKQLATTIKSRLDIARKVQWSIRNEVNDHLAALMNKSFNQEFLTPINGILNCSMLFTDLPGYEKVDGLGELIQVIYSSGFRLQRSAQNLTRFASLNSDAWAHGATNGEGANLEEVLKTIVKSFDNLLIYDFRHVETRIVQDGMWHGNIEAIKIIFTELVDNAIKFSSNGSSPHISLTAMGDKFELVVTNSLVKPLAFKISDVKPFRKFHDDLSRNGLGLGLCICKSMCDRLGLQFSMNKTLNEITFTVATAD